MALFWRRQKNIEDMLNVYQERLDEIVQKFEKVFVTFLDHGYCEEFHNGVMEVSKLESSIDDLRREIEMLLYGRQLLPESRGDLLGILEAVDRIPNGLETVLFALHDQRVEIPEFLKPGLRELMLTNVQSYHMVRKALDALFHNPAETLYVCKEVDVKESESDRLERELIRSIFRSDAELAHKSQLKDVVLMIGSISDRGENCADRISIIAIKRNI